VTYRLAVLVTLALLGLAGCSGKNVDPNDPAALMQDAEDEIKSDHYQIAIDKLRTIRNKFPYSKYSLEAQLRIADVYFMQELWGEAATAYETFRDLHPKHEKVAYAMFRVGKSHFNDTPSPLSRDLTPARKSLEAYEEFLRRFPSAPEAVEARKDVETSRRTLADKELYIADFYYKRDIYDSARTRYEKLIQLYPETDASKTAKEKVERIDDYARRQAGTGGSPAPGK
jgi:outer membrane protein assembly factor BamD